MQNTMLSKTIKKFIRTFDPEVREISRIILNSRYDYEGTPWTEDCDKIFFDRLIYNPIALKMSFWEKHFEWKSILRYPEIKEKTLDFGCGSGHLDVILARMGLIIHGIDISPIGIRIANHLRSKERMEVANRLSFDLVDIIKNTGPQERFHSVWSTDVFEHILEPTKVFCGLKNWVVDKAPILISVPLGYAYDDPSHVHHWGNEQEAYDHFARFITITRIDVDKEFHRIRVLGRFS